MLISFLRFRSFLLSIILFCFFTAILQAKINTQEQADEDCQQLVDKAWDLEIAKNYSDALQNLFKAEIIAKHYKKNDFLWDIYNRIGRIYVHLSNYGEALNYFQESISVTQSDKKLKEKSSVPLANIGHLYLKEKKYDDALHYSNKAYEIAKRSGSYQLKKSIANNIAWIYNLTNKPEKSLEVLNEVEKDTEDPNINFYWKGHYIKALLLDGQITQAKDLADKLYTQLNSGGYEDNRDLCYVCIVNILSQVHENLKDFDSAIYYAKKGLIKSDELAERIDLYENISNLYFQKGEFKTAFQYKDSVVFTKDSLTILINRNLYEINKVRLKTQEYQNELIREKERKELQRLLFIAIIIFTLVVFFSIYRGLRNKISKQKQKAEIAHLELEKEKTEHLLAEKELETVKNHAMLKQEQLKNEISEKNRELSAKALYLSNRNELIQDIINSLEANNKTIQNKETTRQISIIKNFLKTDDHQDDFMKHFENVNPVFIKQLKQKHPKLTSNDTRFLCYVFMNLSLKEISIIFNITYDACVFRKRRIVEKMGFDKKKTSLYDYLLGINN